MLARTQGLELPAPPLCAQEDLTPANQQPLSLPTPPAPFHQFPQLEDMSGQARRRATAGEMGARVTCTIVPSASQPSLSAHDQVIFHSCAIRFDYGYLNMNYNCRSRKCRQVCLMNNNNCQIKLASVGHRQCISHYLVAS